MRWKIISSINKETAFIEDQLIQFNHTQVPFTQANPFIPLNFHIKNEKGCIIAGVNSSLYCWNILYIDILFVEETYQNQGLGSLLLKEAEAHALQKGSKLVHLDTFDFQAKDFYLKQGYKVFGFLDDCPPGHIRYFLKKVLA